MNFEQARSNMVLNQLRANRIRDIDLIEKIEDFPREDLFPKDLKHLSYSDQIITLERAVLLAHVNAPFSNFSDKLAKKPVGTIPLATEKTGPVITI